MTAIKKILIANRGEIAVRVIRTCREMNIKSVAIFSDADRFSKHVRLADEAVYVGESPVHQSYLNQKKILKIAKKHKADAIHPGYGFLSENAEFAQKVIDAGIIFIGPPAEAIRVMGDKTAAKKIMRTAGVPVIPGTKDAIASADAALKRAEETGWPVLLKAAAGGGGKGMRIVENADEMESQFERAASEAGAAFGDSRIFLEKYLKKPRHIEFQVFVDHHKNAVHLFERECSIQRRHQKVVEEAPSSILDAELREEMGKVATQAALACNYTNAGTVEFLVDEKKNFYFLEMNTRLQVEHPVTEMITGLDLVRLQIEVAEGKALPVKQEEIQATGHAIECRIYAEDPKNNFLPFTGKITHLEPPDGPGVREDSGIANGDEVTMFYDPMLSKLVAFAENRELAITRMLRALREYRIAGVVTTIPFCEWVLQHDRFKAGNIDTGFIEQEFFSKDISETLGFSELDQKKIAIAATLYDLNTSTNSTIKKATNSSASGWKERGWKNR
ncbi:MAG: acetyl-CoA carboxylase biotin carboxylase subunit [Calditrichaeota bacterium]|nr:MAG: acetyl-CoA carboxylase biotin carboxylase subunit [Calditrichota bacterium]